MRLPGRFRNVENKACRSLRLELTGITFADDNHQRSIAVAGAAGLHPQAARHSVSRATGAAPARGRRDTLFIEERRPLTIGRSYLSLALFNSIRIHWHLPLYGTASLIVVGRLTAFMRISPSLPHYRRQNAQPGQANDKDCVPNGSALLIDAHASSTGQTSQHHKRNDKEDCRCALGHSVWLPIGRDSPLLHAI